MISCVFSSNKILLGDQLLSREHMYIQRYNTTRTWVFASGSLAHVIRNTHLYSTTSNVSKMVSQFVHKLFDALYIVTNTTEGSATSFKSLRLVMRSWLLLFISIAYYL